MTKRVVATLVLMLIVLGCGGGGEPVQLSTGVPIAAGGGANRTDDATIGCFTFGIGGKLVSDPRYGTAVIVDPTFGELDKADGPAIPVAWPPGYTGNTVGSEVQVHNRDGTLVAVTGHHYSNIEGGYGSRDEWWSDAPEGYFWACGGVN